MLNLIKPGSKTIVWMKEKKKLISIYDRLDIRCCEISGCPNFLTFHHLQKRSHTGGGIHTFEATRLITTQGYDGTDFHHLVEYNPVLNQLLIDRGARGFSRGFYNLFMEKVDDLRGRGFLC